MLKPFKTDLGKTGDCLFRSKICRPENEIESSRFYVTSRWENLLQYVFKKKKKTTLDKKPYKFLKLYFCCCSFIQTLSNILFCWKVSGTSSFLPVSVALLLYSYPKLKTPLSIHPTVINTSFFLWFPWRVLEP